LVAGAVDAGIGRRSRFVADAEHDLAGAMSSEGSLESFSGIGERERLVDRYAQLAVVGESGEFRQLLTTGFDDEVDGGDAVVGGVLWWVGCDGDQPAAYSQDRW
jgi:hypothetical protein